ncbi:hypothetical protein EOK75_18215 (plasmid) [Pseudorhodobacter turbinis]|uniref:Uncharacterized protein n=1 Tax=Pseudorhodobacter turbinis TaxID=2500533 RepID=A0A4P8EKZ8_9RHOB|nr:hypothetical protein [Pseudorhodobacter turbinis]QCO57633.1 hypothetical protein EOK75_18215 [Pseudorhodobacter turbinis]
MAVTLKQVETVATYPDAPTGLSTEAAALDPVFIWQRIEAYVCHRFTARAVVWTVEGPGDWEPPLIPATVNAAQVWAGEAWSTVELSPAPDGFRLVSDGPYRITATVGGGTVPAAMSEAFRRLAEYVSDGIKPSMHKGRSGASSVNFSIGGDLSGSFSRNPAWMARAMINSGAADLLRPYRRAT